MNTIPNRYEFVFLFDVTNGNPNGDPDAGNMPRIDPETNKGIVSDVCLKRKIRNYIDIAKSGEDRFRIYMKEKSVLNNTHLEAYDKLQVKPISKKAPKDATDAANITKYMCDNFYDIRTFGAVMTTEVNAGQVRGPIQLAFSTSIDTILPMEISITRMAVTNEKDQEKERTMGRKHIVPYGLYRVHGYISAKLAEKTGFDERDLDLFWESLTNMFEHDRSAARGEMVARNLIVFKHESIMGNAPAHKLFELVKVERSEIATDVPVREYSDYIVSVDEGAVPDGVELQVKF